MSSRRHLTDIQVRVAEIFFGLEASAGYVVFGGAGLIAANLIARPTQDLDFFASSPTTSVDAAKEALMTSLVEHGYTVVVEHDGASTFCRLAVELEREAVLVDLAIDSPPSHPPTVTLLGPTLAPLELAGRKMLALYGRAKARDFADVYVLAERFGKVALLEQAAAGDGGFIEAVFAQMVDSLRRIPDADIPIDPDKVPRLRSFFAEWSAELA